MTVTTVPSGVWTEITTTEGDTVFQNQSPREMYLSVESSQANLKDGFRLDPWKGIVISSGKTVKISVVDAATGYVYSSEV